MTAQFEHRQFDKGCSLWVGHYRSLRNMPHWHFEPELIVCQSGTATVVIDGRSYLVSAGNCLFCPGESVHAINGSEDSRLFVLQYDLAPFRQLQLSEPLFEDRCRLGERLEELCTELRTRPRFYAEKTTAMLTEILVDITRQEDCSTEAHRETRASLQYKALLKRIESNAAEMTFEEAAAFMHMSTSYFSRFFRHMTGLTFSRYRNIIRIQTAITILQQQPQISAVELMSHCGFNTLRNFNRVFKTMTGYTPTTLPSSFTL